jgi:hypothetical protein
MHPQQRALSVAGYKVQAPTGVDVAKAELHEADAKALDEHASS